MCNEPDLSLDIDALFDHLINNLDHDVDTELEWCFLLRSEDMQLLEAAADGLEEEFSLHLQDSVEEEHADGSVTVGPPILVAITYAALAADEVKQLAARFEALAAQHNLTYEGVSCSEGLDDEDLIGWLSPEEAAWRLRAMTDCGLEPNAELPWAMLLVMDTLDALDAIATGLQAEGFDDQEVYDEPDEDGLYALCLFVAGENDEAKLMQAIDMVTRIAEKHEGELRGVQFFDREEMQELFGMEGDEESA